jgi:hypothetical protein
MTQVQRILTYLFVALAITLVAWFGTPHREFVPTGVFLPAGKVFSPISAQSVQFSNNGMVPGTVVGAINIEYYAPKSSAEDIAAVQRYASELAAKHGANRVVITTFMQSPDDKTIHFVGAAVKA